MSRTWRSQSLHALFLLEAGKKEHQKPLLIDPILLTIPFWQHIFLTLVPSLIDPHRGFFQAFPHPGYIPGGKFICSFHWSWVDDWMEQMKLNISRKSGHIQLKIVSRTKQSCQFAQSNETLWGCLLVHNSAILGEPNDFVSSGSYCISNMILSVWHSLSRNFMNLTYWVGPSL